MRPVEGEQRQINLSLKEGPREGMLGRHMRKECGDETRCRRKTNDRVVFPTGPYNKGVNSITCLNNFLTCKWFLSLWLQAPGNTLYGSEERRCACALKLEMAMFTPFQNLSGIKYQTVPKPAPTRHLIWTLSRIERWR
jgi:hypothetical protein